MLDEFDSDEWESDSDETSSSESEDEDSEQLKGRAFWVKRVVTDESKKKKEEKKSARVSEGFILKRDAVCIILTPHDCTCHAQ